MTIKERKTPKLQFNARMQGGSQRSWRKLRRLLNAYKAGADTREAAGHAGIAERTVNDWLQRGRNSEQPYTRLATAVERLRSAHVLGSLAAISATRAQDPRQAMWLLEHSPHTRDRYGARVETEQDAAATNVMQLLAASMAARVQSEDARAGLPARALASTGTDAPRLPAPPASSTSE